MFFLFMFIFVFWLKQIQELTQNSSDPTMKKANAFSAKVDQHLKVLERRKVKHSLRSSLVLAVVLGA